MPGATMGIVVAATVQQEADNPGDAVQHLRE